VHTVELSTAVVKVMKVIKVINGSLSQNQYLQCVMSALSHADDSVSYIIQYNVCYYDRNESRPFDLN